MDDGASERKGPMGRAEVAAHESVIDHAALLIGERIRGPRRPGPLGAEISATQPGPSTNEGAA